MLDSLLDSNSVTGAVTVTVSIGSVGVRAECPLMVRSESIRKEREGVSGPREGCHGFTRKVTMAAVITIMHGD